MVVRLKLRSLNRCGDMIGSAALRSAETKAATAMTVATISPMMTEEPQAYVVPPHVVASTRPVEAAARSTMPATSSRGLVPEGLGRRRNTIAEVIARIPSGTFIQNAQRQPIPSVNHPPSSGPATDDNAKTPPM